MKNVKDTEGLRRSVEDVMAMEVYHPLVGTSGIPAAIAVVMGKYGVGAMSARDLE